MSQKRGLQELLNLPKKPPLPPMDAHMEIMQYGFGYVTGLDWLHIIPLALREPNLAITFAAAEHCPSHGLEFLRRLDGPELIGLKYISPAGLAKHLNVEIPDPCPVDFFQVLLERLDEKRPPEEMRGERREKMLAMRATAREFLAAIDIPIHPFVVAQIKRRIQELKP